MDRHRSCYKPHRSDAERKKRHSSSSSPEDERRQKNERFQRLERIVKSLNRRSLSRGSCVQRGDEQMIPLFDPSKDELVIEKWIEHVDELAERYGWDEHTIMRLISSRLEGHARQWYDTRQNVAVSWAEMKELLKKQFRKPIPFSKLLTEAALYKSSPGQTLGDYCFQKLNKLRKLDINIPEEYLIDAVIGGIADANVARTVRSAQHTDANALCAFMTTLDSVVSKGEKSKIAAGYKCERSEQSSDFSRKNQSQIASGEDTTSSGETIDAKVKRSRVECFNCGLTSHIAKECRKPRIECTKCKRLGHHGDECPRGTRKDVNAVTESKSMSNLNVRAVYVNGHKVKGLIDSGSAYTLLRMSVTDKYDMCVQVTPDVMLRGVAGQTIISNKSMICDIRVMEAAASVRAIVVPDSLLIYDIVVGHDFIEQEHIVLIKRGNELILKQVATINSGIENTLNFGFIDVLSDETIRIGNVSENVKQQCIDMISEYHDCISFSIKDLRKTNAVALNIKCTSDAPVVYRPYRLAAPEKEALREIIQGLLENEIIRESSSSYASPVLLVKKSDEYHMCVDFRKLNAVTMKDKYPMPLIEEQIIKLGGNRYFISLDLASGYYQVPVADDSIEKTAFVTPNGHYEFLRMPFGLSNTSAVFQRLMDKVLGNLKNSIAFPDLDDVIIIPFKTVKEGMGRLRQVLNALRKYRLTLKLQKCSFFMKKIEYLGREISKQGVRPGKYKIDALKRMEAPQSKKQVRQFLGLAGYFRRFMKNFATIAEPLTRLTKKNEPWSWGQEQEGAFKGIKSELTIQPVLAIFDPHQITEVHTDVSKDGVGAVLLQRDKFFNVSLVAYFSKQTTADQRCYHSYELETMAVVLALRHFRMYLLGQEFTVVTGCNALCTTFTKRDLLPRIGRWWLEIQDFTFHIQYYTNSKNAAKKALRGNCIPIELEVTQDITEDEWILAAQLQDEQLSRIHAILTSNQPTQETKHYFEEYLLKDDKVYRRLDNKTNVWVVPRDARFQVCMLCHDDAGHLSIEETLERIKRNYWFAGMRRFVSKYINACLSCANYKNTTGKMQCKLNIIDKEPVPFHTVHIDHVGPFEISQQNNKFLLVMVDAFTKFVIIEPVQSQETCHVITILTTLTYLFGVPTRVVSDRGTAFTSQAFRTFCDIYGIKHVLNAVATPRANGKCERYNKTIVQALAITNAGCKSYIWDKEVKQIQSALNTTFNKSIATTPVALIRCNIRGAAEARILSAVRYDRELSKLDLRIYMSQYIDKTLMLQKERYDKRRQDAKRYHEGDLVLVQTTSEPASRKLFPKFKGPFRVRRELMNDRYEVEDLREGFRRSRTVAAADRMKPWITMQSE